MKYKKSTIGIFEFEDLANGGNTDFNDIERAGAIKAIKIRTLR